LSALGVYGTLAYRVRQRAMEIGVRVALGATRPHIVGWVARQSVRLLGRGAVVGLLGALALSRLLGSLLYGIQPSDPPTALGVVGLLAALGATATVLPAWRAAVLDPVAILRRG
jgi:ABC-type antimicrobial peptide transport system permease subunit